VCRVGFLGPGVWKEASLDDRFDAHVVKFQCPNCGHELEQTIGQIKSSAHMNCPECGVGINIDADRLSSAADEIQKAIDKVPPEITIKFYR
jgi:transcription elongation factor Elf1